MKNIICCLLKMILTGSALLLPAYGQAVPARHHLAEPLARASFLPAAPPVVAAYFADPCAPKNPPPGYFGYSCVLPQGSSPSSQFKISFAAAQVVMPRPILRITSPKGTTIFEMKLNCKVCGKPNQYLLLSLSQKEQEEAKPFFTKDNKLEIDFTTKQPVDSVTIDVIAKEKK